MQSYIGNDLKNTFSGAPEDMQKKMWEEMEDGATHVVIGKIPSAGEEIKVHGLIYTIISSDKVRGRFIAKIKDNK